MLPVIAGSVHFCSSSPFFVRVSVSEMAIGSWAWRPKQMTGSLMTDWLSFCSSRGQNCTSSQLCHKISWQLVFILFLCTGKLVELGCYVCFFFVNWVTSTLLLLCCFCGLSLGVEQKGCFSSCYALTRPQTGRNSITEWQDYQPISWQTHLAIRKSHPDFQGGLQSNNQNLERTTKESHLVKRWKQQDEQGCVCTRGAPVRMGFHYRNKSK